MSGSGKSTLARDVLYENLHGSSPRSGPQDGRRVGGCKAIKGWQAVERVLEVDQTPIGKTPRSCPATYVGFWDNIRKLFADTHRGAHARLDREPLLVQHRGRPLRGCEGQGMKKIEMSLPARREGHLRGLRRRALQPRDARVQMRGKSVGEVLAMSVDEAVEFFAAHPSIHHCLRLLQDVGLGYLTLGQQSPTLSGGEAQRIKLVTELAKVRSPGAATRPARTQHTLYVLDEPTVGLHMADVEKLIRVLHRLVDAGNTVVVIEHNLDVIAEADWIVDLGPEGGDAGGRVVLAAPPEEFLKARREAHTAKALREFMAAHGR